MKLQILSVFAAAALLAACDTSQNISGDSTGDGSGSTVPQVTNPPPEVDDRQTAALPSEDPASDVAEPGSQREFAEVVGDRILFDFDKYDVRSDMRAILETQAAWLRRYPAYRITIEGHADERGSREYNLALGQRRANAVRNYLVSIGLSGDRVADVISYGEERPTASGQTEDAFAQNRRSVTVLVAR